MSQLAIASLVTGSLTVAFFAPALLMPLTARKWCRNGPRSVVVAWILTALALAWSARLLWTAPFFVGISCVQPLIAVLTPLSFILLVVFLDELLAARALGGLFLLIPRPILDAAFCNDSPWKPVITLAAYFLVLVGAVLILSPFRFRKTAELLLKTDRASRITGAVGAAVGTIFIALALAVY